MLNLYPIFQHNMATRNKATLTLAASFGSHGDVRSFHLTVQETVQDRRSFRSLFPFLSEYQPLPGPVQLGSHAFQVVQNSSRVLLAFAPSSVEA